MADDLMSQVASKELASRLPKEDPEDQESFDESPENDHEKMSVLYDQVMDDVKDAMDALQAGNTKKTASILGGILKQHSDRHNDRHPDMETGPNPDYRSGDQMSPPPAL